MDGVELLELKAKLKQESISGGELTSLPCPFCGKPRSQRSDYIRCTPCGMNWLQGEDLDRNPKLSRAPYLGTRSSSVVQDGSV